MRIRKRASVLECGCPLPLWLGQTRAVFRKPSEKPKRQRTAALQDARARSQAIGAFRRTLTTNAREHIHDEPARGVAAGELRLNSIGSDDSCAANYCRSQRFLYPLPQTSKFCFPDQPDFDSVGIGTIGRSQRKGRQKCFRTIFE